MIVRVFCVALLISCLPIAGCGTVANLACMHPENADDAHFGGVKQDLNCIHKAANGESIFRPDAGPKSHHLPQAVLVLCCAADLPFSFVGDLLVCPYVHAYACINQPIPVPLMPQAMGGGLQFLPMPESKDSEQYAPKKDANQGKQRKGDVDQLPMPKTAPNS